MNKALNRNLTDYHTCQARVYYSDTDSYGVVWHGSYVKWLEMGRVEYSEFLGLGLENLAKQGITLPVVELNIRYKSPALIDDRLIIQTKLLELKKSSISFSQTIKNKTTDKVHITAKVTIVAIDTEGKLYRQVPDVLTSAFEKAAV